MPAPIVGIDLGTTNSLISFIQDGKPTTIPNIHGDTLTPSIVSIGDDGEIFVGKIAKERQISHPKQTAAVFKRHMGTNKKYSLGTSQFTPEELSSFVLKKLKEDAEAYIGQEIVEAVISVPAYFNDAQRRATKLAGELAGFKVERIVNEPTAASLAYGLHESKDHAKFLIFDLGGGTFDISILEKYKNVMEVRAVAGDVFLGGEDFTDALQELFIKKISTKIIPLTIIIDDDEEEEDDDNALSNLTEQEQILLRKTIENAKQEFAINQIVTINFTTENHAYETTITTNEYEEACKNILNQLRVPIKNAISDAAIKLADISSIILVGGATKLPIIRSFATKLFGRFPHFALSPDEVVGLGAAVHAGLKERNETISEIVLTDVCPFTLGVDSVSKQPNGLDIYDVFLPIIERNSTIPTSRVERVYTLHDQQNEIHIRILQGENRRASENSMLGELTVAVPKAAAGTEGADIRFTYDINGILECEVTILSNQVKKSIIIEKNPGIFTPEEIAEKLAALAAYRLHPRDKDEYRLLLSRGERLYQENLGEKRRYIGQQLILFDQVLNTQDEKKIRDFVPSFKEFLDSFDNGEFL